MQAKWEDFKIEAKVDIMPRVEEPYRVKKFIKNHRIMNEEWERKKREQSGLELILRKTGGAIEFWPEHFCSLQSVYGDTIGFLCDECAKDASH